MNRIKIVQALIQRLKAKTYLEIGVSRGHAFLSVTCPRKIGVDPKNILGRRDVEWGLEAKKVYCKIKSVMGWERPQFFEMTSDEFFEKHASQEFAIDKIDVVLIDGLHTYDQALRDVQNSLKYLADGGVIVMHDCNPTTPAMAVPALSIEEAAAMKVEGWDWLWCGDTWKTIVHLRSLCRDLDVAVLDCDMGVGFVVKGSCGAPLSYSVQQIAQMGYHDLRAGRQTLLNLQPANYFYNFLSKLK